MSSEVILRINGTDFAGWTGVRITRSIEQVCDTFNLTLTERWEGADDEPPRISAGDACEVLCDGDLVITGYVDDALPNYDAEQHTISVSGRSKAADIVDCGLMAKKFNNKDLLQLANYIAGLFGIPVRADCDVDAPFKRPAIESGQTGFEFLEKHARQRGVRLVSDSDGTLVITRTGTEVLSDALELGVNIKSASGRFSMRDRFNEITVVGQTAGDDNWNGEAAAKNLGKATDKSVRAVRKHVLLAEQSADAGTCRRRAEWQRNTAYGRGEALTYTVNGWRHSGGLWRPNTLVHVYDKWMRLSGEKLLISAVQMITDKEGQRTELQVMPPEAFDLVPLLDKSETEKWN